MGPASESLHHLPTSMGGEVPSMYGHIFTDQHGGRQHNPGIELSIKV